MNSLYLNRELSWLDFNLRVLEEAQDPSVPLLERLRFLSITSSNLDEFFMVRVGGLQMAARQGSDNIDPAGLSVTQQLTEISSATHRMTAEEYACFGQQIEPALADAGIRRLRPEDLSDEQLAVVEHVFVEQLQSILTPMVVHADRPFPLLPGLSLNMCVQLAPGADSNAPTFALIPFGRSPLRFITLPSPGGYQYILADDVVAHFVQGFFPGKEIVATAMFRITRNADMSLNDDDAADFIRELESVLTERRESFCVRLELSRDTAPAVREFLETSLEVSEDWTFVCDGPIDLAGFSRLADLRGFEPLRYPEWVPAKSPLLEPGRSLFDQIRDRDVLLHHPYESFDPVVRFVEEAAEDPDVVAIKQTLYRTSRSSPIVNALLRAAENDKHVTVLVELKARFDEQRNIAWAKRLEQAGVQVIYGVKGLKTHAKICTVVRREPHGFQRYVHVGTGNYNEITARFYTDVSYFTAQEVYGADAITWFNAVCGYSQPQGFRRFEIAPLGLRRKILEMIHVERNRSEQGQPARIMAKLNSLVDPAIIEALYEASQAGVEVDLNVRGICCLRPGVPGLSDNIRVISIVDRFLEHARLLYFYHAGDERVFISSADWMPRNLDRRIELLVPVEDKPSRTRLIEILTYCLRDTEKARQLQPDGSWIRLSDQVPAEERFHSQLEFQNLAIAAAAAAERARHTTFIPHQSPQSP